MGDIDVRTVGNADEFRQAFLAIGQYFGMDPNSEGIDLFSKVLPYERMHAAFDDGRIIGGAGAFPFEMSVPGGRLRCAGTTVVGVAPTHRRRGVLRAMMRAQLDDAHERGEPIASLWAAEEPIYGRFGFGRAAFCGDATVKKERIAFARPLERRGTVRLVDAEEARETFPPLWDALARERPGMFIRSPEWWDTRTFRDPADRRGGAGPKRYVLLELDGAPAGYAIYRHEMSFEAGASNGKLLVAEAIASTPQANAELWRYLLDVDWVATIELHLLPPDHPLFFLLAGAAAHALPGDRLDLDAPARRRRRAVGPDVRRRRRARVRRRRRVLPLERGHVAARRRRRRAHRCDAGHQARRPRARRRLHGRDRLSASSRRAETSRS